MGRTAKEIAELPHIPLGSVRSLLYVPSDQTETVRYALRFAPDGIILDLQDSVARDRKEAGRENIKAIWDLWSVHDELANRPYVCVRLNSLRSDWAMLEADLASAAEGGVDGILLPEVETVERVREIDEWLRKWRAGHGDPEPGDLLFLIETGDGVDIVEQLATLDTAMRPGALLYGREDLVEYLRIPLRYDAGWTELGSLSVRSRIVWAGRRAGIRVLDSPTASVPDLTRVRWDTDSARQLGFDGRQCIHPSHVAIVEAGFDLDEEALGQAERAVREYDAAVADGQALAVVDDAMVDRPIAQLYRRGLDQHREWATFETWKSEWKKLKRPKAKADG